MGSLEDKIQDNSLYILKCKSNDKSLQLKNDSERSGISRISPVFLPCSQGNSQINTSKLTITIAVCFFLFYRMIVGNLKMLSFIYHRAKSPHLLR